MVQGDKLFQLLKLHGIDPEYIDIWGQRHTVSEEVQRKLLLAMSVPAMEGTELDGILHEAVASRWKRCLEPVKVIRTSEMPVTIPVTLSMEERMAELKWAMIREDGGREEGVFSMADLPEVERTEIEYRTYCRHLFTLPVDPSIGYHRFMITKRIDGSISVCSMLIIVAPDRCYLPPAVGDDKRIWGMAVQLYSLKSHRNWGIGDLTDLKDMSSIFAGMGCDFIGINPIHALFPNMPLHTSPYSPSSRLFFNTIYLDVESIPDFQECSKATSLVKSNSFQSRLKELRECELIDYAGVSAAKREVLNILYDHFCTAHLENETERGHDFRAFISQEGETLERFATFNALHEWTLGNYPDTWGWPAWPAPYRDPASEAVRIFCIQNKRRIGFYQYLQWQISEQLNSVNTHMKNSGLALGLYLDMAVSVDRGGADVWNNKKLFAEEIKIGAPPDDFNLKGQDWGLPPIIPSRLYESGYAYFSGILQKIMRYSSAIRIDHIMALMRLFCIPNGIQPADGTYIMYPLKDLLSILSLESHRNRCLVIGEDLGTVPDSVREAMDRMGIFCCKLLYFTREWDGELTPPEGYGSTAIVSVSTHDLPTLKGYWEGRDLSLRTELDLYPSEEVKRQQYESRGIDRVRILRALERAGLLPEDHCLDPAAPPQEMTPELSMAIHRFLARTTSKLLAIQLEDIILQGEQMNLPGTVDQYPNWRIKIRPYLDDLKKDQYIRRFCDAVTLDRQSGR